MEKQEYFEKLNGIRNLFLEYLNNENGSDENYLNFTKAIEEQQVPQDKEYLKEILYLINSVSNYHYRTPHFFDMIERVIVHLKDIIHNHFTNFEIFRIFVENKRVLLILFNLNILIPDSQIASIMLDGKYKYRNYHFYFFNELSQFLNDQERASISDQIKQYNEDFDNLRKVGENDGYMAKLIRQDLVEDFIRFVNQKNINFNSTISSSIFETNPFLMRKNAPSLIEYSAFYGSIQIFKYLQLNGVDLQNSLWFYVIHGHYPELVHLLEENKINPSKGIITESIKCHYDDMTNYIFNCVIDKESNEIVYSTCLQNRNYAFLHENDVSDNFAFYFFCKYDYVKPVRICLNSYKPDVNAIIVQNKYYYE